VPSLANAKVTFNTTVTTPSPANASSSGGATSTNEVVEVLCTVNGNKVKIVAGPLPVVTPAVSQKPGISARRGNFRCTVTVEVIEGNAGAVPNVLPAINQTIPLSFPCLYYAWGVDYAEAYERCHPEIGRLKDRGVWIVRVDPGDPPPYFVAPEELVDVLKLESLARSLSEKSDPRTGTVVEYMVGKYNLPRAQVIERLKPDSKVGL